MEAQKRHLAGDHHSAVDVPITPRSASLSALTRVDLGVLGRRPRMDSLPRLAQRRCRRRCSQSLAWLRRRLRGAWLRMMLPLSAAMVGSIWSTSAKATHVADSSTRISSIPSIWIPVISAEAVPSLPASPWRTVGTRLWSCEAFRPYATCSSRLFSSGNRYSSSSPPAKDPSFATEPYSICPFRPPPYMQDIT